MRTEFVTTKVILYDAEKNIFVDDTKFTAVENCFELRLNGQTFRKNSRGRNLRRAFQREKNS